MSDLIPSAYNELIYRMEAEIAVIREKYARLIAELHNTQGAT